MAVINLKEYFRLILCVFVFVARCVSPAMADEIEGNKPMQQEFTNRLIKEKSPYLQQHAHNPVEWYPWGEEAFYKAKNENKPIFLSIGYSTCHWCHVMERESFEDPEIAKIMNEHFISVKVDREERPDLDQIYMSAVTAITGQGGWPLNVFLTPDRKPFYGGTYFPPEPRWGSPGFTQLLLSISEAWTTRREQLLNSSETLTAALNETAVSEQSDGLDLKTLDLGYSQFAGNFDPQYGGFGNQPKFPSGHNLSFLLRYWKRARQSKVLEMVTKTLNEMGKGGIRDHLGGGFHRYSTDQKWHVPHFEKMLYDQAVLARTYLEAYQATGEIQYAQTARDIFDYVLRDMQYKEGGFFSAEDADSFSSDGSQNETTSGHAEKKEGAFYVWTQQEIERELGSNDAEVFDYMFGVEPSGNADYDPHGEFTGKNILYLAHDKKDTALHFKRSEPQIEEIIERSKKKLFEVRTQRPRPHLDDKILVDWNGLMISSLAFGSRVLGEPRYKEAAVRAAEFVQKTVIRKDGRLLHRFRDQEAAINANLGDYAFFIQGLLDLYEATFEAQYLKNAHRLAKEMVNLFWDEKEGGFFFTAHDGESLIARQKDLYDGAYPSGNSIALLDLIRLGHITFQDEWNNLAQRAFKTFAAEISQRPAAYSQTLIALDHYLGPAQEIVLAAPHEVLEVEDMAGEVFRRFIPNKVVVFRNPSAKASQGIEELSHFIKEQIPLQEKPTAYVCENHVCKLPTNDMVKFGELLDSIAGAK